MCRSCRRKSPPKRSGREGFFEQLRQIEPDEAAAIEDMLCAIHGNFDAAIAAHASARGAVLVTADRTHMPRIPSLVIEDWTAE